MAELMDIKIIVATHKEYWMPAEEMYFPIQAGADLHPDIDLGYHKDNTGDNISIKNPNYCELTALYWAWKNLSADYLGLAHYRRHFSGGKLFGNKKERVLTQKEAEEKLRQAEILLPKQRHYRIETNYSQYVHAHHAADLDMTREILSEHYPEYAAAFDTVMRRTYGHRFNMFIMKRDLADAWCAWMFDVLFELEKRLDLFGYSEQDSRVFGFVGERLLDVWLETNRLRYLDIPYVFMESQNWFTKGGKFLMRKFGKKTC